MKWVEIITLRSLEQLNRDFVDQLVAEISESDFSTDKHNCLQEIRTYYNYPVESDMSIHIYWESEKGEQQKSPFALRVHSALTSMGLLNHSIWIERTNCEFNHRPAPQNQGINRSTLSGSLKPSPNVEQGEEVMKLRKHGTQAKIAALEATVKEWGLDLKRFRAKAAKANGSAKQKLEEDAAVLRNKLDGAKTKLADMKKSGKAASAELARGVEKARSNLRKAFRRAKAKLE